MKPRSIRLIFCTWLLAVSQASAGMTVVTLTDMARMRFDALSFFVADAEKHDGNGPAGPLVDGIERALWRFPGGGLYCLMPGVRPGGGRAILVYEPSRAGGRRFVLLADGTIEDRSEGTLKQQIEEQMKR